MATVNEALQHGWRLHQAGQVGTAETIYRGVLDKLPRHPDALVYLGIALFDQRQFEASAAAYRAALAERETFPVAWNNLGNTLRMLRSNEQADACFARALEQRPGYLSAFKNRGTLWVWSGEIERGLRWYEEGLKVDPDHAELHRNLGVIYLLLGHYDKGFDEYRWRWRMGEMTRPQIAAPVWAGEPLSGRTIALYPEQGLGDAIHFVRLAAVLSDLGAHVIMQCPPSLIPLFSSVPGIAQLMPAGMTLPSVDFQASLIDAVDGFYQQQRGLPTGATSLLASGYLSAPENLVGYWRRWLESHAPGRRIGINWQGNPEHNADVYRSLPLAAFRPLAERANVTLVSLQFGEGREQLAKCDIADAIVTLPENLDTSGGAFLDTAAIVRNLDQVVTSDTAIAHLAGALGVNTTVMLGKVPDWRWGLEGDTTPWYPNTRLVRQTELGDWKSVIDEVNESLTT